MARGESSEDASTHSDENAFITHEPYTERSINLSSYPSESPCTTSFKSLAKGNRKDQVHSPVEITQPLQQENKMSAKRIVLSNTPDRIIKDRHFSDNQQNISEVIHDTPHSVEKGEAQELFKIETLRCAIATGLMDLTQGSVTEIDGEKIEQLLETVRNFVFGHTMSK
ncbi:hypothetical protein, partial [Pseudomonas asplenii]|uniref:hypothetical protein n=1 Tax=Pseudomonas asplenii TaxID=53407 RepID=UPI0005689CFD